MAFLVVRPAQCQWKVEVALASFVLFATQPVVGVTMVSLLRSSGQSSDSRAVEVVGDSVRAAQG